MLYEVNSLLLAGKIMEKDCVVLLENASKKYRLYKQKKDRAKEALHPFGKKFHKDFYAVKDLDLKVKKGEILGIIGRNGSGKSTLLKLIAGVITPTGGTVKTCGNVVPLLELGSGLNPEYSGLENIYFYSSILGFTRKEAEKRVKDIIDFADIGDFIYQPLKTYSSGMKARLAFAVSVNIDPDILILDEVLAVGDELFRRKSFAKMEEFFKVGKTILFVSHSANSIIELCTRAVLLDHGEILLDDAPKEVVRYYHQLLFSKFDQKQGVKNDILKYREQKEKQLINILGNKEQNKKKNANEKIKEEYGKQNNKKQNAYFIPNFVPKSTKVIRLADVDLYDFQILTKDGRKVNVLVVNEEYIFSYNIRFGVQVDNLRLGMSIRTEKGLVLSSSLFPGKYKYYDKPIHEGDVFIVKWKFKCLFQSQNYYLYTSISSFVDGKIQLLSAVSDALVFKVIITPGSKCYGMVSSIQEANFNKIS